MSRVALAQALQKLKKASSPESLDLLDLAKGLIQTREENRAFEDGLFQDGHKTRKAERKLVGDLFQTADQVISNDPMFSKTAAIDRFFEEKQYLSEAQKRFPELLDVLK